MFSELSLAVDRLVGAADLPPADRERLALAQAVSTLQMAPVIMIGSVAVALGLSIASFPFAEWWLVATWAFVVVSSQAIEFLIGRRVHNLKNIASETVLVSFLKGGLWGSALLIITPEHAELHAIAFVAVGGMAVCVGSSLVNHPYAAFASVTSFVILAGASVLRLNDPVTAVNYALLLAICPGAYLILAIRQSRIFVAQTVQSWRLADSEREVSLLLNDNSLTTRDWLWGFDVEGNINRVSKGLSAATFLRPEQLIGLDFIAFLSCVTAEDDLVMQQVRRSVLLRQPFSEVELRLVGAAEESWWRISGEPVWDEDGTYKGFIGTGSDISERRRSDQRMSALAHNDSLTGLHNRTKFNEALNQCVSRLERYGSPFALLYLDLDNFKLVNDSRGHMAGDKLLIEVGRRINSRIRESDFSARLGGDEFAIIVTEGCTQDACATLAQRLIESISQPIEIDGEPLDVGVSIGLAFAPTNGTRPDQLQRNADLALYRAKQDGRSVYRFFESQMDSDARERRLLEMELRDAIRNGELMLYYQPLVSATDKVTTGFEALMRWQHPIRGLVSPAEFIPIAEQSSLIVEIGDWTIAEACAAAAQWPGDLTVAVNLSAKHFRMSDIAAVVRTALATSGLSPHRLELEVTEGLLMVNADEVTKKLEELQGLGVTIVMDDFGTGYSSLSYLLKFPFDKIKIDRSFVAASSTDPMARDILRAIASLGKTLRLSITAEGVETIEQAEFLSEIACHQLQGFYFARPLNQTDMPIYLLSNAAGELSGSSAVAVAEPLMAKRATA